MPETVTVCRTVDLPPGRRKLVRTTSRGVIGVFNVNGHYHALKNVCPHRGAALCRGLIGGAPVVSETGDIIWTREGEILRCSWHGWEFDIETGQTLTQPTKQVATYPVSVEDDMIVLHLN